MSKEYTTIQITIQNRTIEVGIDDNTIYIGENIDGKKVIRSIELNDDGGAYVRGIFEHIIKHWDILRFGVIYDAR